MLAANGAVTFVYLIVVVLIIASFWVVFTKANQPGWASLIPIYNLYIMSKMNGRSAVWTIVYLIPIIGQILLGQDVAKSFGQSAGYGIACGSCRSSSTRCSRSAAPRTSARRPRSLGRLARAFYRPNVFAMFARRISLVPS
jgi:hypothetical protein